LLAGHFLQKYSSELGRQEPLLSEAVLQCLLAYAWPGNVRELENLMERASVLCRGTTIDMHLLPQDMTAAAVASSAVAEANIPEERETLVLEEQVSALEKRLITAALERSGDNKSAASRLLGVSERTLWYKIKKYGL
jgi:two-component system response regulator AtoC